MLVVFLISLAVIVLPVFATVYSQPRKKERAFLLIPTGIVLQTGLLALFAMSTQKIFAAGFLHLFCSALVSSSITYFVLQALSQITTQRKLPFPQWHVLAWIGAVALIVSLDSSYILGAQGWSFQDWSLIPRTTSYFSNPFQSEGQRNVILINAILRRDGSPFLEGSPMTYPLFWYHLAAVLVGPLKAVENFGPVSGVIFFTHLLLCFTVLWAASLFRPSLWLRPKVCAVLLVIAFCHADIYHFLYSLIAFDRPGIESDGSFLPLFIRNYSLKLAGLTAPAQALFLCFAALFLAAPVALRKVDRKFRDAWEATLVVLSTLASPVMALLLYPPLYGVRVIRQGLQKKDVTVELSRAFVSAAAAFITFWLLNGNSAVESGLLPLRGSSHIPVLTTISTSEWFLFPLLWLGTLGALGVLVTFLGARLVVLKQYAPFRNESLLLLVGLTVLYHYGVTGPELRRFYAMIATLLAFFSIAALFPPRAVWNRQAYLRFGLQSLGIFALSLHLYFMHAHTGRTNLLDHTVEWKDYHEMNQTIRSSFPSMPTIAGSGRGQMFPSVMEATPSLSNPAYAFALGKVTPGEQEFLARIRNIQDIPSYSLPLGYRAVIWGPVEDRLWGERVKRRFVDSSKLLAQTGTVQLFALTDHLRMEFEKKYKVGSPAFHFEFGQALSKGGWMQEALDQFYDTIRVDPKSAKAHNAIGLVLSSGSRTPEAITHFSQAIRLDPKFRDAYNNLGALLVVQGQHDQAIDVLTQALKLAQEPEMYVNLGQAYASKSDNSNAVKHYEKALSMKPALLTSTQAYLGLGDIHVREGDFGKAVVAFKKVIKDDPNHELVRVKLGNCLAYQGKTKEAVEQYNAALRINPRFEPARRAIAALASAGQNSRAQPSNNF